MLSFDVKENNFVLKKLINPQQSKKITVFMINPKKIIARILKVVLLADELVYALHIKLLQFMDANAYTVFL